MLNNKIFKKYDIRGVYPEEISEESAYKIGKAYAVFLNEDHLKIAIGRDGRRSSPALFDALKKGMMDSGVKVFDIGLTNTPLLNFAVCRMDLSGGIMVTASHNPPEFNGMKLIKKEGLQIYGDDIQAIKKIAKKEDFREGKGGEEKMSVLSDYISHILSFDEGVKGMRIAVDYGHGVASVTGKPVFEKLEVESVDLYEEVDGDFPAHLPSPEPENMKDLINLTKKSGADLGIFFDGDGDRSFFVSDKGEVVYPDLLIALMAKEELSSSKEKKVYFDLRFSRVTEEKIIEAGGKPEMMRVGNPFYKEKLIKEGGLMGAELSGHIMHKDNFCIDDGLFMSIKLLNFLSRKEKPLSELIKPLKKYHQSEEINVGVRNKKRALKDTKEAFPEGRLLDIDGVYIEFDDWWFSLRESNTEDLVRLRLEARTEKLLEEKKEELVSLLKGADK